MEESVLTIFMIRHAQTILNVEEKVQGWIDSPLTSYGISETHKMGRKFASFGIEAVYSSDLFRAVKSAQIIMNYLNKDVFFKINGDLREGCCGCFEGKSEKEILDMVVKCQNMRKIREIYDNPDAVRIISDTMASEDRLLQAETFDEVKSRMITAIDSIIKDSFRLGINVVLVVAHSNSIIALLDELGVKGMMNISHDTLVKIGVNKKRHFYIQEVQNYDID